MEVMPGYKHTEVGVVPDDWEVRSLGEVAKVTSGKRLPLGYFVRDEVTPYPYIRVTDMRPGGVDASDIKYVPEAAYPPISKYRIFKDDLFISVAGTLGIVGGIPDELDGANLTENANRISAITCHKDYLLHVMLSPVVQGVIESEQTVGAQPKLALMRIRNFSIPLPPTAAEQRVIATALSNVDALLDSLDRLIAKKRNLKQAAMQQLLTGQTRLPGFSGDWEIKPLCDVLRVRHGKSQHGITAQDGKFPILASGGEIGRTNAYIYDQPSVLIGRKGTIDAPRYMDTPFWTVDTLFFTEITKEAYAKFVFYKFLMIQWRNYNEASGVPSLNARTIERVKVNIPPFPEQTAIADLLTGMDSELEVLEQRRNKTAALKEGMMQELLSGRTRLV